MVSNAIRYDSLLVRYLADELHDRLRGRDVKALILDPERRQAALSFGEEALIWRLHPSDGAVLFGPPPALPETVPVARRARVRAITAPPDERLLIFEFSSPRHRPGRTSRIVVELMGNQWNVIAVDPSDRIVALLWRRSTGERRLFPGAPYVTPPGAGRRGVEAPLGLEAWRELLGGVEPARRRGALIGAVAYTSPINAEAILGAAATDANSTALEEAYARYVAIAALPPADPHLLRLGQRVQPYPLPLPGVEGERHDSLIDAVGAATGAEPLPAAPRVSAAHLDRLRRRVAQLARRRRRLEAERADAGPEAERLRNQADLLLSQLHLVRKGMESVELPDFAGGTVEITLDPALTPTDNARRLYDAAKKRERAAARLPEMIERLEREQAELTGLLDRAEAGDATPEEVEAAIGPEVASPVRKGAEPVVTLPYRRYRTSGGLEVRVGRGRKANDELTFRHSSPNDVWLHARDVGGAHVVLRWDRADANPPARDLAEAAVLAALNSKARTSGTVAVDWTRRKYVRKPRKAPPGLVVLERSRTVFVEPDASLEERLRA